MTVLVAGLAVLLGYAVKGLTGFGSAIVAIPLLSLVIPPAEAILTVVATDLLAGAWLVWGARARVRWRIVAAMYGPLLVGQWWGTDLLAWLPVRTTRTVLAGVVALLALVFLLRPARADGHEDRADAESGRALGLAALAGALAGFMSGVVGAPGPPLVAWVRRFLSDATGRAVLLTVFFSSSVALVAMLLGKGVVAPDRLLLAAGLTPVSILGAWIGSRGVGRIDPVWFGRLVGLLLLVAAAGLLAP